MHWERVGSFGDSFPHSPRRLSFRDAKRGAIATDLDLAVTDDGGRTWQRLLLPEKADEVAAIALSEERGHLVLRVLDEAGALWRSDDGGRKWAGAPSPVRERVFGSAEGVRQMPEDRWRPCASPARRACWR